MRQGGMTPGPRTLAAIASMLVLVLVAEWGMGEARIRRIGTGVAAPALQTAGQTATLETAAAPDQIDAWLATALGRPLMAPNRRPVSKPSGSSLTLNGGLPRLAGTVTGGGTQIAIFARDQAGHPVIVHEGGTLGPYRVTEIAPRSVTLDGPDGRQVVHPSFGSASSMTGDGSDDTPPPPNMPGMMQPNFPGLVQPMPPPPAQPDSDGSSP